MSLFVAGVGTAVFSLYDSLLNNEFSCDFGGNAEKKYMLNDQGLVGSVSDSQCLIRDTATVAAICGAMRWACFSQNFANVSGNLKF